MRKAAGNTWIKLLIGLLVCALTAMCAMCAFLELLTLDMTLYGNESPDDAVNMRLRTVMDIDMKKSVSYFEMIQTAENNDDPSQEEFYERELAAYETAFDPYNTNFRFKIRSASGEILLTNIPEGEDGRDYQVWELQEYTAADGTKCKVYGYVVENMTCEDDYFTTRTNMQYLLAKQPYYMPIAAVTGLLLLLGLLFLLYAAGRRNDEPEIRLRFIDRIPWDVTLIVDISLVALACVGIAEFLRVYLSADMWIWYELEDGSSLSIFNFNGLKNTILWIGAIAAVCMAAIQILLLSWAARWKVKGWWKNSLIIKFCAWVWRGCKKAGTTVVAKAAEKAEEKDPEKKNVFVRFFAWLGRGCVKFLRWIGRGFAWLGRGLKRLAGKSGEAIGTVPLVWKGVLLALILFFLECVTLFWGMYYDWGLWSILLNVALCAFIVYLCVTMKRLQAAAQAIADGDLNYRVDTSHMLLDFRVHGEDLNRIGDGLSLAVEDRLKSERMKTELITNVSHDLKTPLTSIVNYVDLLKKEELTGTAGEYVEVLDRQSARLKKLTEDLVEASKASTGNLHVTMETINLGEFLEQAQAEYAARLVTAKLETVSCPRRTACWPKATAATCGGSWTISWVTYANTLCRTLGCT